VQRLEHAERVERAVAVGADLDAGAEFAQLGGLLEDLDIEAALLQRDGSGQTADAAAGDEDFGFAHDSGL